MVVAEIWESGSPTGRKAAVVDTTVDVEGNNPYARMTLQHFLNSFDRLVESTESEARE
jgi:hypothetical protein